MNKIIAMFILFGLLIYSNGVFAANYIYTGDAPNYIEKPLPKAWKFIDGTSTGNFDIFPQSIINSEGWFEVTFDNSATYDRDIQDAGGYTYMLFADHAEKLRILTNKPLNAVKKEIGRLLKAQGIGILKAKWSTDEKYLDLLTAQENTDMDADILTIKNSFATLRTNIMSAVNVQDVKTIMTGATWPNI